MAFVYSKVGLVCILCTTACLLAQGESEWRAPATAPSTLPFVPYPEWAHFHWVWLTHSVADQDSEIQLVKDYFARDIPVGAVDIDSEWSTGINNFKWDLKKYPDPQGMIDWFHSKSVRVILWATSMVNTDSDNYQEGCESGYFLNCRNCSHCTTIDWWHGYGSLLDYSNPYATDWWNSQLDNVLDMGIDGWKCDGTDPYIYELVPLQSYGPLDGKSYADYYYGGFFNYTRTKELNHASTQNTQSLIMSRPVDSASDLYHEYSPRYVMYSGWVGDQDPTFSGLKDALGNMFHSAWSDRQYSNYGSDIGGYRGGGLRDTDVFVRWAQLGALVPLMENGGDGEHRPWAYGDQVLSIYRKFVYIHYEYLYYFLSIGARSMEQVVSVMRPQTDNRGLVKPIKNFCYSLWTDVFVCPIVDSSNSVEIIFPGESGETWIDYWTFGGNLTAYAGGDSITYPCPLEKYPVFIREGALLPLHIHGDLSEFGDARFTDYVSLLLPLSSDTDMEGYTQIRREEIASQEIWYSNSGENLTLTATAHDTNMLLFIIVVKNAPRAVVSDLRQVYLTENQNFDDFLAAYSEDGWTFVENANGNGTYGSGTLYVKITKSQDGVQLRCVF